MAPKYLTSAGHAVAQRKRWENRLVEQMQFVAHEHEGRAWRTVVRRMIDEIDDFPVWARSWLLASTADDDPTDEIDRLGRTIATASYNEHVLSRLVEEGFTEKMWLTRHDPKVRPAHRAVDGQTVPISRPFRVGGYSLLYPGHNMTAPPELWFGCRCMVLGRGK